MGDPGLPIMAGALAVPVAVLLLVLLLALMGRRWVLTGPDAAFAEDYEGYDAEYEEDDLEPTPYRPALEPPRHTASTAYDAYRPVPAAYDAYGSTARPRDSHAARRDGYATQPREPYGRPAREPYAPPRPAHGSDWEPYESPRAAQSPDGEAYAPSRPAEVSDWEPYAPSQAAQSSEWEPYVPAPRRSRETPPQPSYGAPADSYGAPADSYGAATGDPYAPPRSTPGSAGRDSYGSPAPQDEYADTAYTYDRSEPSGYRDPRRSAPDDPQGFPYGPYGSR
ncbi:hypothetical protein AB0L00_10550 [Actinoallomurus sp. NPDC052308]|uniref:hypothetical protein n=1 Tax=Actinoallomurus sp. NPDC052308 TaxID=3155530 RepID=UPI003424B874